MKARVGEVLGLLGAVAFLCGASLGFGALIGALVAHFGFGEPRGLASLPPAIYWKVGGIGSGVLVLLYGVAIWPILGERDFYRDQLRGNAPEAE